MKSIGIDYGTKHIGVAISDENGSIAFPHEIIDSKEAKQKIVELTKKIRAERIVIGIPKGTDFSENEIEKEIRVFADELKSAFIQNSEEMKNAIEIIFIDEQGSSQLARYATVGKQALNGRKRYDVPERVDAQAAAILLQRYLDGQ